MDDSKKKPVMIAVIVGCLAVAGVVTFLRSGDGSGVESISDEEMTWVKCNNPACKAEYEMKLKTFYKQIEERLDPMSMAPPSLICEKCSKPSVYRAVKCQNPTCALVFFRDSVPNDFPDRCPECKQSAEEEKRKARQAGGQ